MAGVDSDVKQYNGPCVHHDGFSKEQVRLRENQDKLVDVVNRMDKALTRGEERLKAHDQRLESNERQLTVLQDLTISINKLVTEVQHLVSTVANHETVLEDMRKTPGKIQTEIKLIFYGAIIVGAVEGVPWLIKALAGGN